MESRSHVAQIILPGTNLAQRENVFRFFVERSKTRKLRKKDVKKLANLVWSLRLKYFSLSTGTKIHWNPESFQSTFTSLALRRRRFFISGAFKVILSSDDAEVFNAR